MYTKKPPVASLEREAQRRVLILVPVFQTRLVARSWFLLQPLPRSGERVVSATACPSAIVVLGQFFQRSAAAVISAGRL